MSEVVFGAAWMILPPASWCWSVAGEGDAQHLAVRALSEEVDAGVLHRHLRAEVAVHPLHHGVLVRHRALGDEVVDVGAPVLDRRVADAGALLHDDLDHGAVEAGGRVRRGGAALDVMHAAPLVGDDQRPLELAHVLGVDPEVGLERQLHVNALGNVDERAARPDRGVQRGELVVVRRDDGPEVLAEQVRVLLERLIRPEKDDALLLEVLADVVVDDLGVILPADAGEVLLLRLGDAELVVRAPDVVRHVVPALDRLVRGRDVVVDVLEVDSRQVGAPLRHRSRLEMAVRLEAQLRHPRGLALETTDLLDDLSRQALAGDVQRRRLGVVPAELVAVWDLAQGGVRKCHRLLVGGRRAAWRGRRAGESRLIWSVLPAHCPASGRNGQPGRSPGLSRGFATRANRRARKPDSRLPVSGSSRWCKPSGPTAGFSFGRSRNLHARQTRRRRARDGLPDGVSLAAGCSTGRSEASTNRSQRGPHMREGAAGGHPSRSAGLRLRHAHQARGARAAPRRRRPHRSSARRPSASSSPRRSSAPPRPGSGCGGRCSGRHRARQR